MSPLSQLNDIKLPEPVSLWPPAPGWWLLTILALVLLILGVRWALSRYRRGRVHREALKGLTALRPDDPKWTARANAIIKTVFIHYLPEQKGAQCFGQQWAEMLVSHLPAKLQAKYGSSLQQFCNALYRPEHGLDARHHRALIAWLKKGLRPGKVQHV